MRIIRALFVLAILAALSAAPRWTPLPAWMTEEDPGSVVLRDRHGKLLAELRRTADGDGSIRGQQVPLSQVDPLLVHATLAAEDRRFYRHPGIDPLALARAVRESLLRGGPIRGASTLTMQVVRMSRGQPHGIIPRLCEVWWSLVLESHTGKEQILETYLNRAPYGPNIRGVSAGSRRWFGKPPSVLSPAEAALLAAIPRAPSRCDPVRRPAASRAARNVVLERMKRCGWLTADDTERACSSALDLVPQLPRTAPHFDAWVLDSIGLACRSPASVITTLDSATQALAEAALRERLESLGGRARGGAVIVLDTPDAAVRAMVGSRSFDSPDAGQVNMALSPRQPGSAVKPFTYAVAFAGSIRPSTILADVPTSYEDPTGVFTPRNYAGGFAGPVSARLALANSWNVPTLDVLARTGLAEVAKGFEAVRLAREEEISRLGLGLTLGVGEVTLLDLAAAYATLARGGDWLAPRGVVRAHDRDGRQIPLRDIEEQGRRRASGPALEPVGCAWVNAILSDPAARAAAFERGGPLEFDGPVAAKTGTSSDWRDAWAVLYSTRHTVAVWMGNPDGSPTDQVTGAQGSAVVACAIMASLEEREPSGPFPMPECVEQRAVCPLSGSAAGPNCPQIDWAPFRRSDPPLDPCRVHVALRIDRTTGLLARSCTPPSRVRTALYAQLPERFAYWQMDRGFPGPPEAATECACGSASCCPLDAPRSFVLPSERRLAIVRPIDGTEIALDPTLAPGQQMLALEAAAPTDAAVDWYVDGVAQGTTRGQERIFWPVRTGEHRIAAKLSSSAGHSPAGPQDAVFATVRVFDPDEPAVD